eukprot:CAMPEP_0172212852 /NCGR_PEP_ID=MMETSP1050-20130122/37265_1 /TAXON_ID=233186 /ORGANISM="Cryptomonas curvata, Strain CCAP979/52" /LENGTH=804 /DNA_ID=CAMNT_0012893615 /DNA_START=55 /DNA_END=2471 /DNA_ORIENTATION=-
MAASSASAESLELKEVLGWFPDASQKAAVFRKYVNAQAATEKHSARWAHTNWARACTAMREAKDALAMCAFELICELLDKHCKDMEDKPAQTGNLETVQDISMDSELEPEKFDSGSNMQVTDPASGEVKSRMRSNDVDSDSSGSGEGSSQVSFEGPNYEWKEFPDKAISSIDTDRMYFVNREDSVGKLVSIHQTNYNRARGGGDQYIIPLDHVLGLGKTEFSLQYISSCLKLWDRATKTNFQEALCNCHTIRVTLPYQCLITAAASMEAVILKRLTQALQDCFRVAPQCLADEYVSSYDLLRATTSVVGPLFIVLDEIGNAFTSENHEILEERAKFFEFCRRVLETWLNLDTVFFLLIGCGSFFSHVGRRPENLSSKTVSPSNFKFERLPLRLLKPGAIRQILLHTRYIQTEEITLVEHFGLTEESKMSEVVNRLFVETNGHPRQLLTVLKNSETYEDLLSCIVPHEIEAWDEFCNGVLHYKSIVLSLLACMKEGEQKDMSEVVTVQGKTITLDEIAASAYIAWDGKINQATLYTQPSVLSFLTSYVAPFEIFIQALQACPEQIPLDYADAFELMLMKRFQQMFSKECSPSDVCDHFFNTVQFGRCERVSLPEKYFRMAKKTTRGCKTATLGSKSADPSCWPRLMQEIDSYDSICLKPAPQSSSPDVLFSTRAWKGATEIRLNIFIAAKNYRSTAMSQTEIDEECSKANRIFEKLPRGKSEARNNVVNVLFICSTNYAEKIKRKFSKVQKQFCFSRGNLHEVIVLDLSSKENRAEFFGEAQMQGTSEAVEMILAKGSESIKQPS